MPKRAIKPTPQRNKPPAVAAAGKPASAKSAPQNAALNSAGSIKDHATPATAAAGKAPVVASEPARSAASPSLDLASLEQRLRDTHAIGVFTKLSLKNQVDDLLGAFRAYYRGTLKVPLAQLRQRYDLLLLKVLTVLQDGDPSLANTITASREAIWGILADPQKFASL
jgi:hypothetical protein